MRPTRLGPAVLIALAMSLGAAAPALSMAPFVTGGQTMNSTPRRTDDAHQLGMKQAPALLQKAGLPCQLADARVIGSAPDPKTRRQIKLYEVACAGAMGYVLIDHGKDAPVQWAACLEEPKTEPNGKPNAAACQLPANADGRPALAPFVAKAGGDCPIIKARGIGHSPEWAYFEVSCLDGRDYVLRTSAPPDPRQAAQLLPCLDPSLKDPISCNLLEPAAQLAYVDMLAGESGKGCEVKDKRYVLTSPDLSTYYEVACEDGKGYMLQALANGRLGQAIGCADANYIGGGCTLTSGRAAQTRQASLYSKLAKAAGYDCDVSKYYPFASKAGKDVDELACSNRPDGAIGVFPADPSERAAVYNCALSELVGYRCAFSKPAAAYPQLTGDLAKLGKPSCAVSGERIMGVTAGVGYVEVACADGDPGYVMSFQLGDMSPKGAVACSLAKDIAGGCQMPQNRRT